MLIKLALRNIKGAGLRTWLNVLTISFIYVLIVWHQGLFTGMQEQMTTALKSDQLGGGQFWHKDYDPYDALAIDDSHAVLTAELNEMINKGQASPMLFRTASIYPEGRLKTVVLRGVVPDQKVTSIDTESLADDSTEYPVMIGSRMASSLGYKKGDLITIRWRDAKGTFDAVDAEIVDIFTTLVPALDSGQIWMPLKKLMDMAGLPGEATVITVKQGSPVYGDTGDFRFKSLDTLLSDTKSLVLSKRVGGAVLYAILMFLAMLAIFDSQVLSIFRRRKEIGTLVSLGMTIKDVIRLFTLEGALQGILAAIAGSVYGIPLIILFSRNGMPLPAGTEGYGLAIADRIYPIYTLRLVLTTIAVVMLIVVFVSYWPTRKIARMDPTEALRGKIL